MDAKPYGRDEVRAAIIDAAKRRFAAEGPSASLRDIARDANVNLGLLHRHFGTKQALVKAIFDQATERGVSNLGEATTLEEALDRFVANMVTSDRIMARIIAGMLIAGEDPLQLQREFPTVGRLAELAGDENRSLVLLVVLATLGWEVFARNATVSVGYVSEEDASAAMVDILQRLGTMTAALARQS